MAQLAAPFFAKSSKLICQSTIIIINRTSNPLHLTIFQHLTSRYKSFPSTFYIIQQSQIHSMSSSQTVQNILNLFTKASESSLHFVVLIEEAFEELGADHQVEHLGQWKTLSETLNTPSKISCLRDRNHRALIIQFMKADATGIYKSSYFNHAKIDAEYLAFLKQVGPFEFAETIAIVNKLKLIEKHHKLRMEAMSYSESHIETHIRKIMEMCASIKRSVNNNLNKFKAIVEFEDRIELIKALGKLLRQSWSSEKKMPKASNTQEEAAKPMAVEQSKVSEGRQKQSQAQLTYDMNDQLFNCFIEWE